jgi:hypothetical protein
VKPLGLPVKVPFIDTSSKGIEMSQETLRVVFFAHLLRFVAH